MREIKVQVLPHGNCEPRFVEFRSKEDIKAGERVRLVSPRKEIEGKVSEARIGGEFVLDCG
jgi:hypothetical protein